MQNQLTKKFIRSMKILTLIEPKYLENPLWKSFNPSKALNMIGCTSRMSIYHIITFF